MSQKTTELLQPLIELWGGNIYIDRGTHQSFKWYLTRKEDILNLIEYFKLNPSRSAKKNRLHLVPKYYQLKDLKAHKASSPPVFFYKKNKGGGEGEGFFFIKKKRSLLEKSWSSFLNKWLKYESDSKSK